MDRQTGTFLSVDPVVPAYDDPQSYNAYSYARNNPVNAIDPRGSERYFVDSYIHSDGTLVTVQTNSAEAAGAAWFGPFEVPTPAPGSAASGSGLGGLSLGDVGGTSLAGLGAIGGVGTGGGQSASSGTNSGTNWSGVASKAFGAGALASEAVGAISNGFPSTSKYAQPFKTAARNYLVPATAFVDAGRAASHVVKGEGKEAVARAADAGAGVGITFGIPALMAEAGIAGGGPVAWGLGLAYFGIGGFDGIVYGAGYLSEVIIEAGPNGPIR